MALVLDDAPLFLSVSQVSQALGRHPRTLRNWRLEGTGPIAIKIGARWAYPRAEVESYLAGLMAQARESSESAR
jgi:hypothetical protein